ncbi:MAG: phosphotyrosine protein phosphatase [Promethearchaeota archaeon]|nr:MAG: phosphotyrosine protein phosphatase [Candidatus Lokiarchaeota archaeon]
MKLLFVCTANSDRSPTAEEVFKDKHETKSAGIFERSNTVLTRALIKWADKIFCMQEVHKEVALEIEPNAVDKIIVLGIEDIYSRGDPILIKELKKKVGKYLDLE